ncbi:MAG: polysaccharide deacetylase family protein [Candidatus Eisenbacteria bacterium]|nr:polysaccharide deacetylase family protein [Candidatus Eisenbacteria bacterium]
MERLSSILADARSVAAALARSGYPPFVLSGAPPEETPVFVFHRAGGKRLGASLRRLVRNGYRTLSMDEYLKTRRGARPPGEREALLTFDDGLADLHRTVFPLLREHRFTAVSFIAPARIGSPGLVDWEEARRMHESGVIDFQSHTLSHRAVPASPRIAGFHRPTRRPPLPWEAPERPDEPPGRPHRPGEPIYASAPRLADEPAHLPDPAIRDRCAAHVAAHGGEAFFRRPGWRRELMRIAAEGAEKSPLATDRRESPEERTERIREELLLGREAIEERLPGKRVAALAYPWNRCGAIARSLLSSCGYEAAFTGMEGVGAPSDPYRIPRLSGDFLDRLPGEGRTPLPILFLRKTARRIARGPHWSAGEEIRA